MAEWQGLNPQRFKRYASWINQYQPGICGTYCAAVLVHDRLWQDLSYDISKDKLINGLKQVIDDHHLHQGTFVWNIYNGLERIMAKTPYRVAIGAFPEKGVPQIIDAALGPVIVGSLKCFGSTYGNHWLLVYAYRYKDRGRLQFMAYDNHGDYQAIIDARETFTYAYLVRKEESKTVKEKASGECHVQFNPGIHFKSNQMRTMYLKEQCRKEADKPILDKKFLFGKSINEIKELFI